MVMSALASLSVGDEGSTFIQSKIVGVTGEP